MRKSKAELYGFSFVLAAVLFMATNREVSASSPQLLPPYSFENVYVITCWDGDTCQVNIKDVHPLLGKNISIRIRGVQAPEIRGKCVNESEAAKEAALRLRNLMVFAKKVNLTNVGRDKYFRLDADVTADGVNVAKFLLQDTELAVPYDGLSTRPNPWCTLPSPPLQE